MPRPAEGEFPPYMQRYIDAAKGNSVPEIIANHTEEIAQFYQNLPEEKADYAYAPGKWTIKEVLQHVIDAERIFTYRALRIARKDTTPLPGFDENNFAANSLAGSRTLADLKEEFAAVRKATIYLLQSFNDDQLQQKGTCSNVSMNANAIVFILTGHLMHHKNIFTERYL